MTVRLQIFLGAFENRRIRGRGRLDCSITLRTHVLRLRRSQTLQDAHSDVRCGIRESPHPSCGDVVGMYTAVTVTCACLLTLRQV